MSSNAPSMRSTHSYESVLASGQVERPTGHLTSSRLAASNRSRARRRRCGAVDGAALTLVNTKVAMGVTASVLDV